MREPRYLRPVQWWVWPAWGLGEAGAFFLAAVSAVLSMVWTVVWFSGLVWLAVRERRYLAEVRALRGRIRAVVVEPQPELPTRPALPGRRAVEQGAPIHARVGRCP